MQADSWMDLLPLEIFVPDTKSRFLMYDIMIFPFLSSIQHACLVIYVSFMMFICMANYSEYEIYLYLIQNATAAFHK